MPSNNPRMAEISTSQTRDTEELPNTQLTVTRPVLADTSAIKKASSATTAPAYR